MDQAGNEESSQLSPAEAVAVLQNENAELRRLVERILTAGPRGAPLAALARHHASQEQANMDTKHAVLFSPIKVGKMELKNRYAMCPMGPGGLVDESGAYTERGIDYYVARAKGGAGLLITGVTRVENEIERGRMQLPCVAVAPFLFLRTSRVMTERVHAYGARIFLQLTAGFGRVALPAFLIDFKPVAPSVIPHRWVPGVKCRELTREEIHTIVRKFAEAAALAQTAGFDGVEIHAVHEGYLLDQFAISMFNNRTDEYGGSLENRLRLATEIVQAVKGACGSDFPVSLRFSLKSFIKDWCSGALPGEEFVEKGRDIAEGIEAAKILEAAGYDMFNVDVGSYDSWYWSHPPMYHGKGLYLPYSEILRQHVKVPVITAGRMDDPDLAASAIESGKTDIVGLARPLLADPDLPNKIRAGMSSTVRPCISCQEGCMGRLANYGQISCAVNPSCGREGSYAVEPSCQHKQVLVVGGGVGGMEAARVCALRGHSVHLYERSSRLGGLLIPGGVPSFKEDEHKLVSWFEQELKELGVQVHLCEAVTMDLLTAANPDVVVFATGSLPRLKYFGPSRKNVFTAEEVLNGADPGGNCIVLGGGTTGCELALHLKQLGKTVTIVEEQSKILARGAPLCHANKSMLEDMLHLQKISVHTSSCILSQAEDGVVVQSKNGATHTLKADSVVLAIGATPNKELYEKARNSIRGQSYLIGDANGVSNIMKAIWDAYEIARTV